MHPKISPPLDDPHAAKKSLQVRYGFFCYNFVALIRGSEQCPPSIQMLQFHSTYKRLRTVPTPDTDVTIS